MGDKIAFENSRISDFQGLVTLDQVILHTVMHQSSTSTNILNFIEIEKNFLLTASYCQIQSHVTQKLGQNKKSGPDKLRYCGLIYKSVVICQPHCKWGMK